VSSALHFKQVCMARTKGGVGGGEKKETEQLCTHVKQAKVRVLLTWLSSFGISGIGAVAPAHMLNALHHGAN
jgi:hypothetical protein